MKFTLPASNDRTRDQSHCYRAEDGYAKCNFSSPYDRPSDSLPLETFKTTFKLESFTPIDTNNGINCNNSAQKR